MTLASLLFRRPPAAPAAAAAPPEASAKPLRGALKPWPMALATDTGVVADQPDADAAPIAVRERLALFAAKR